MKYAAIILAVIVGGCATVQTPLVRKACTCGGELLATGAVYKKANLYKHKCNGDCESVWYLSERFPRAK